VPGRRPPRGLGPEDLKLWESVTRGARPLRAPPPANTAPAVPTEQSRSLPVAEGQRQVDAGAPGLALIGRSGVPAPAIRVEQQPDIAERLSAAALRMDRRRFVAMSRGKAEPEDRIDLHGMTLAEAHIALSGFILRAHGAGRRLVLVITGKGGGMGTALAPPHDAQRPRGALRQQVPIWLDLAPLSMAVLQVAPAHRRHGGVGAYYVYLRRPRVRG
jgi:DNA-nicking Smr family endonuclease